MNNQSLRSLLSALRILSLGFGWSLLLLAFSAFAQTNRPAIGPRIIVQGGQLIIQASPGGGPVILQPGLDPLLAAQMQGGGDQPATAQAEFDPPVIHLGQGATYRVTVTAMIEGVSLPDNLPAPAGLQFTLAGRSFTYGAGGLGVQPRTTFNFRVSATSTGPQVMPSFTASANGKPVSIPEARLTVLAPAAPGALAPTAQLRVELPEGRFFIGQAIPVRLVMFDSGDNSLQAMSQPQASGDAFISENWRSSYRREIKAVEGKQVSTHVSEVFAYPIKAGVLQLAGLAYAHVRRGGFNPANPQPLDTVLVNSDPVPVTVIHLPKDGELPGFTGGIGRFQVEPAALSTNVLHAGEPLTLNLTIKGEGNLTRLVPPKLEHAPGWQVFTPLPDASGASQVQLRGSAVFTYTMIPLSDRVEATPAIPFSCFDPQTNGYVDLTVAPVPVRVLPLPGGGSALAETADGSAKRGTDSGPTDNEEEPILTGLVEAPGRRISTLAPLQQRAWFLAFQLVPAATLGGLLFRERRRRYLAQHPDVVLRARARRGVRRQLRLVRRAARARAAGRFIAAAVNALREASAPRTAANPGALVCADVLQALEAGEREGHEGRLVRTLFSAADAQQFVNQAPDGAALFALQPELEGLLEKWRERL